MEGILPSKIKDLSFLLLQLFHYFLNLSINCTYDCRLFFIRCLFFTSFNLPRSCFNFLKFFVGLRLRKFDNFLLSLIRIFLAIDDFQSKSFPTSQSKIVIWEIGDGKCEYYNNKGDILIKVVVIGGSDAEYF